MAAKRQWYNTRHPATMPGTLFLVATPIGNLEDITFRAIRVLQGAAVIAAEDTRRTATLLAHYGITTKTTSLHDHNERDRVPALVARLVRGEDVAVVTDAGMPSISDPGYLIVRSAVDAGVRVEVVPGASALTAAIAGAGLPCERVFFVGFAPPRTGERQRWFAEWRGMRGTVVFFEVPHRLKDSLQDLMTTLGNREVVVAHELTKIHESWHRGLVADLLSAGQLPEKGEFTIVVGERVQSPVDEERPTGESIAIEFGKLTNLSGLTRKDAISELAKKHGLPKRQVYSLIEQCKKSVE
jgi:16S rRNA (cytidine1402-2'-O)-methyltransferase